ncbi:hypothetical protein [Spirosoma sp.]|uniref:hypothetical protein n=1 Tax=Spirosoma sp. TaxID=1899569 RepID=UPI00261BBFE8|nr:hypothetical protein [Spirosoma sp.]MCX6216525.1 hypothetical protein [Spirosoma sp.]
MISQTDYFLADLRPGECRSCSEETDIVPGDGRCPDCIEEQKFYEMTMTMATNHNDDDDE